MAEIDDERPAGSDADGSGRGRGRGWGVSGRGSVGLGGTAGSRPGGQGGEFEHERLIVYRVAREAFVMAVPWLKRAMPAEERSQLRRALGSVLWNIAEGAGKTSKPDKRRFYEMAKGSATEAAAQLEIICLSGVISPAEYDQVRPLLLRVAKMLSGLCGPPRSPAP